MYNTILYEKADYNQTIKYLFSFKNARNHYYHTKINFIIIIITEIK